MPANETKLLINKLPEATLEVTVIPSRTLRMRIWIAVKLVILAAWVMGWRVKVFEWEDIPWYDPHEEQK